MSRTNDFGGLNARGGGYPGCPILSGVGRIQGLSNNILRTMRKLRRDLDTCQRCVRFEDCVVLTEFNAVVQAALDEVMDEWNLKKSASG